MGLRPLIAPTLRRSGPPAAGGLTILAVYIARTALDVAGSRPRVMAYRTHRTRGTPELHRRFVPTSIWQGARLARRLPAYRSACTTSVLLASESSARS